MPTIFCKQGYWFSFFGHDPGESMEIRATKAGSEVKVWMNSAASFQYQEISFSRASGGRETWTR